MARFGRGWIPWGEAGQDNEALLAEIPRMREEVAALGRSSEDIEVAGTLPIVRDKQGGDQVTATMEQLHRLIEAGISDFRAQLPIPRDPAEAEDYLSGWVQAFRSATKLRND